MCENLCLVFMSCFLALESMAFAAVPQQDHQVFDLYVTEVALSNAQDLLDTDQINANYDQMLKKGEIVKRETTRVAIWQAEEFEYLRMFDVKLLDRIVPAGGQATRVMTTTTLGSAIKVSLSSSNDELKLKLFYQNNRIDELTPSTKTTDVETIVVTGDTAITPRKRLVLCANAANQRTFLILTLVPKRSETDSRK